jgi:hypothetical protein
MNSGICSIGCRPAKRTAWSIPSSAARAQALGRLGVAADQEQHGIGDPRAYAGNGVDQRLHALTSVEVARIDDHRAVAEGEVATQPGHRARVGRPQERRRGDVGDLEHRRLRAELPDQPGQGRSDGDRTARPAQRPAPPDLGRTRQQPHRSRRVGAQLAHQIGIQIRDRGRAKPSRDRHRVECAFLDRMHGDETLPAQQEHDGPGQEDAIDHLGQ